MANMGERIKAMFNNKLLSDVQLIVSTQCETGGVIAIPAHKLLLAVSSPVFFDMFYGQEPETVDDIELDCGYESLLEVLRYIYSDEVILTGNNVVEVMRLAENLKLPSLAERCIQYLGKKLTDRNVTGILKQAQNYQMENVVTACWDVIDKHTEQVVRSEEFATVDGALLEALVCRESLTIKEVQLFEAVNDWANKQCELQGLVQDGNLKRRLLGERIVKKIRFPSMTKEEFVNVVLDEDILTPKECFDLIKHFSSVLPSQLTFETEKRVGSCRERLCRFGSVVDYGWCYGPGRHDSIILRVDKTILLRGICLCGNQSKKYSLNLNVTDLSSSLAVGKLQKCFTSYKLPYKSCDYWGFEAQFDLPVVIEKGKKYSVDAIISGFFSWRGIDGVNSIECSNVLFNFEKSDQSNNGTSVIKGQFPEFLFSIW